MSHLGSLGIVDHFSAKRLHQALESETGSERRVAESSHFTQCLEQLLKVREVALRNVEFARATDHQGIVFQDRFELERSWPGDRRRRNPVVSGRNGERRIGAPLARPDRQDA